MGDFSDSIGLIETYFQILFQNVGWWSITIQALAWSSRLYNTTAFLYDSTAAFEKPEQVARKLQDLLMQHGGLQPPGILGDLGSGTGLISILMAQAGWEVYGVELSAAMRTVAQQKAAQLESDVQRRLTFTVGDITTFQMPENRLLDSAVCLCNTINHLTEWPQVQGLIRSAFNALRSNGLLILDSDSRATFEGFFNHPPTLVWDDGQHRMIRACQFNAETGRANHIATLERYTPAGVEPVSEEAMALQYHSEPELLAAFLSAGFEVVSVEAYNPNPVLYAGDFIPKVLWVLKKPASSSA